jgi:DedD protein
LTDMAKDPEIIVSTGKMVGLFVVLVVVCALFFGFGYSMGRGATVSATGLGSPSPAVVVLGQRTPAKMPAAAKATSAETPAPAIPDASSDTHPTTAAIYFLQVAAVTKQEDAEALVSALKKKDYAVFATNSVPTDKLFHVQIGPFSNQKDVEGLRAKLVAAGYNPIVKKQA